MSLWIARRDEDGRLHYYSISVPLFLLVAVLAVVLTVLLAFAAYAPLTSLTLCAIMLLLGFALFLVAKISLYRQRVLISFGTRYMAPNMRRFYRLGYLLMIPGAVLTLLLSDFVMRLHG